MRRQPLAIFLSVLAALFLCGGRGNAADCGVTDATTLCLGGRFTVQASWTPQGIPIASGQAIPLTRDGGALWLFFKDNPDIVAKVIDGGDGFFWVFFAGLTQSRFQIVFTDTVTGTVRTYDNPRGHLASVADLRAFPKTGKAAQAGESTAREVGEEAQPESTLVAGFQYSPLDPIVGQPVTFTLTAPADTSKDSVCWDYEVPTCLEGTPCHVPPSTACDDPDNRTPQHIFKTTGKRVVRLTVSDGRTLAASNSPITVHDCKFDVSLIGPSSFGPQGGSGKVQITAPSSNCPWEATSDTGFITVTPSGGSGSSTVSFFFMANPGVQARSGNLKVAGMTIHLIEAGSDATRPCRQTDGRTLCLLDQRFEVKLNSSQFGPALAVQVSDSSGYFTLFHPNTVELMTKVVDGVARNDHFWMYFASMTNVQYTITVRDTKTGRTKTYDNQANDLVSRLDADTF